MFSNFKFVWVYKFDFEDDDTLVQVGSPAVVAQSNGQSIHYLNASQVVIQTDRDLTIFNVENRKIDFKVKFIYSMNVEITVSQGYVAVPRSKSGVLLEFGEYDSFKFVSS